LIFIYEIFYRVLTGLYFFIVRIATINNPRAKAFIEGRKQLFENLAAKQNELQNCIWFHCASLGEFEQARPLIEIIKNNHPAEKILLTFFSPSGYEIKKDYPIAEYVCYLPIDTKKNAERFIKMTQPKLIIFVKYEWWYFILKEIYEASIPLYNIASIFNEQQIFFKFYGGLPHKMLTFFSTIFVQNQASKTLLGQYKLNNVKIAGDTRFDTVYKNKISKKQLPLIEQFKAGQKLIIGGSTYQTEDELLTQAINNELANIKKYIIVPHDIDKEYCIELKQKIKVATILYSEIFEQKLADYAVLIIDSVGMLSNLYQYADLALIGGGFNKGIHNILEAVVFGVPVLFGPKYEKAQEALDLAELEFAFSINSQDEFETGVEYFLKDEAKHHLTKKQLLNYIKQNTGATQKIYTHFLPFLN